MLAAVYIVACLSHWTLKHSKCNCEMLKQVFKSKRVDGLLGPRLKWEMAATTFHMSKAQKVQFALFLPPVCLHIEVALGATKQFCSGQGRFLNPRLLTIQLLKIKRPETRSWMINLNWFNTRLIFIVLCHLTMFLHVVSSLDKSIQLLCRKTQAQGAACGRCTPMGAPLGPQRLRIAVPEIT